jgi:hypothetical protein
MSNLPDYPGDEHAGSPDDYFSPREERAAAKTNAPGIALIVAGVINVLGALYFCFTGFMSLLRPEQARATMEQFMGGQQKEDISGLMRAVGASYVALGIIGVICAALAIVAGNRMRALQSHTFCTVIAILVAIPCISPTACCGLGEAAGIWALVMLCSAEVRAAFR